MSASNSAIPKASSKTSKSAINYARHHAGEILMDVNRFDFEKKDEEVSLQQILCESALSSLHLKCTRISSKVDRADTDVVCEETSASLEAAKFDDDDGDKYKMTSKTRGCFVIFNQMKFGAHLQLRDRYSSAVDAAKLKTMAKEQMNFAFVRVFENLKKSEIFTWLYEIANANHSDYDLFTCVFLTHGKSEGLLYASDTSFHLDEVTSLFTADNCVSLAGKPKLFFIQACRGSKMDRGFEIELVSNEDNKPPRLPIESDFLFAFSSMPGYVSWINDSGSWFFNAFYNCFSKHRTKLDLLQILTKVNRFVARNQQTGSGRKQMPCFMSSLTAQLYF